MRPLDESEIEMVQGGNPLMSGVVGAVAGGVAAYGEGGGISDIAVGATFGFATGTFGGIAIAARSVYYGAVTVGMAFFGGMATAEDS